MIHDFIQQYAEDCLDADDAEDFCLTYCFSGGYCFSGSRQDSEPYGPYGSKKEALDAFRAECVD